jgi:hypothetical protein
VDISLHEPFLEEITAIYAEVRAVLDGRQLRLVLDAAVRRLGRGGIKKVAAGVGVDQETVSRGAKEVAAGPVVDGRVRAPGAGRPPVTETASRAGSFAVSCRAPVRSWAAGAAGKRARSVEGGAHRPAAGFSARQDQ